MLALKLLAATTLAGALAACSANGSLAEQQVGPKPPLPAINQYLVPPMHVASPAPWGNATPTVPADMTVTAFATGLHNVRSVFVLPMATCSRSSPRGHRSRLPGPRTS